jgi:2'-5' RNA ligase
MTINNPVPERARLFFALWPPSDLREGLHRLAETYGRQHGGKPMRSETLHLTLLFLGEVERQYIPALRQMAGEVHCAPFTLQLTHLASWRGNRIGYAAPEEDEALQELAMSVREAVGKTGLHFDKRPFSPHVTLLRKLAQPFPQQLAVLPAWPVQAFSLVESVLTEAGSHYRPLDTWSLGKLA